MVELAAAADGTVLAVRARGRSDAGAYHAYPTTGVLEPLGTAMILPGPYRIAGVRVGGAGAGNAQAAARRLSRRRHDDGGLRDGAHARSGRGATGPRSGRRPAAQPHPARRLSIHLGERAGLRQRRFPEGAGAGSWPAPTTTRSRREQAGRARHRARWSASGSRATPSTRGWDPRASAGAAWWRCPASRPRRVDGRAGRTVRCAVSFPTQGQGHATTMAQLVADRLGVALERRAAPPVDTAAGAARAAARSRAAGRSRCWEAAAAAAQVLRERSRAPGGASAGGGRRGHGPRRRAGQRPRRFPIARWRSPTSRGARIRRRSAGWPGGIAEPGLEATVYCDPPGPTFSGAVHIAVVEVDPDTGACRGAPLCARGGLRTLINPTIVEGQIHGAVAQGIGEALLEVPSCTMSSGQLLTATLMDYALPRADDLPSCSRSAISRRRRR